MDDLIRQNIFETILFKSLYSRRLSTLLQEATQSAYQLRRNLYNKTGLWWCLQSVYLCFLNATSPEHVIGLHKQGNLLGTTLCAACNSSWKQTLLNVAFSLNN